MSDFDFDVISDSSERRPWRPLPSNADRGRPAAAEPAETPQPEKPDPA